MENRTTYRQDSLRCNLLPLYALHLTALLLAAISIGNILGGMG